MSIRLLLWRHAGFESLVICFYLLLIGGVSLIVLDIRNGSLVLSLV